MKRIASIILSISLSVLLCSCGNSSDDRMSSRNSEDREEQPAQQSETFISESEEDPDLSGFDPDFTFSTVDREGNSFDETIFAEHSLTMINFFEPWCGPCVGEMGDLEALYEDYSSQGLLILGVYSETGMESDIDDIISYNGVTYPLLHYTDDFSDFLSGFVPTTVFVDSNGHVVTTDDITDPYYVGSNDYDGWASIIEDLIK